MNYNQFKEFIKKLKKEQLSLEQYLILTCLYHSDNKFLDEYENQFQIKTIDSTKDLYDRKLIRFIDEFPKTEKSQYQSIEITKQGVELISRLENNKSPSVSGFREKFEEFWECFPTSDKIENLHPRSRVLRQDRSRCEKYYKKILDEGKWDHETIIKCLNFEINERVNKSTSKDNKLSFMKGSPSWLHSRIFESYYELMQEEANNQESDSIHESEQELGLD